MEKQIEELLAVIHMYEEIKLPHDPKLLQRAIATLRQLIIFGEKMGPSYMFFTKDLNGYLDALSRCYYSCLTQQMERKN